MNINLRALIFGIAAVATIALTFDAVGALRSQAIIRLDRIEVTAHRENFDADRNLQMIRLEPVAVIGSEKTE